MKTLEMEKGLHKEIQGSRKAGGQRCNLIYLENLVQQIVYVNEVTQEYQKAPCPSEQHC